MGTDEDERTVLYITICVTKQTGMTSLTESIVE